MINQVNRILLLVRISVIPLLIGFFAPWAYAHSPHDVVESVAVSPGYEHDHTLFIYVFDELKRSTDGGHSWKNLENGLDNASSLVSDIAISSEDTGEYTVFAATRGDGIYRSGDRGDTWRQVNTGLENLDIQRLILSPDFDNDRTMVAIPEGTGLFISTTGGDSWQQVARDKFSATAATVLKDDNQTRLLAGTDSGDIYLSGGRFDRWSRQGGINAAGRITDLSRQVTDSSNKEIFIGTELNGLYKTRDSGKSFVHIAMLPPSEDKKESMYVTSVVASDNSNGTADIFVTMWHESVFVSTDGADSWKKLGKGLRNDVQADEFEVPHYYRFATSRGFDRHGDAFIGGFAGLFKTTDGGQSWIEMETRPARNIEGMAVSPSFSSDKTIALAAYDGGAYISEDAGKTWTNHNIGLPSTHLWDISIVNGSEDGLTMYAISNPAFLTLKDTSSAWIPNSLATTKYWELLTANFATDSIVTKIARRILGNPEQSYSTQIATSANFDSDKTLFVGTRYKGVLKSVDGGSTWSHPWNADNGWVTSLKISPDFSADSTVLAAVRERGFYLSTDGGDNWQLKNTGLSPLAVNFSQLGTSVIELSPDFGRDHRLYFGTADGLYLSTNLGNQWERLDVSGNEHNELIRAVGISPAFATDGVIFVSVKGRGLYKSTDRGNSFSAIAPDLIRDNKLIKLFRFSPDYASDHTIFVASPEEAFVSHDSGTSWVRLERPVRFEDKRDYIAFAGAWERTYNAASSAMYMHRSGTPGDRAVFNFVGKQVTWYGPRSSEYGMAKVYLDGVLAGKVDQFSIAPKDITPIFTLEGLSPGAHTLTIEIDSDKNENSSGHYIAIDAMEVS